MTSTTPETPAHDVDPARLLAALERSQADLRLALDAGQMGTWEWDVAGGRVHWSPQEERLYGIPEGSFEGTTEAYAARIHPDDRADAWRLVEEALARRSETHHVLHRIVRPDSAIRWLDSHGRFVYDADGRPLRLVGVSVDVTDRVLYHRLRERQSDMLGAVDVGVWYCDLPFDELAWDAKVKEHFWLPTDARVTIETFYERIHPDDRERTREAIERSIRDRTTYDVEYRTVAPPNAPNAGAVRWLRALGYTGYDRAGNPARFDGITVDITTPKRAAEALAEARAEAERARAQMMEVFEQAPAAISVSEGPEHRTVSQNAISRAMIGGRSVVGKTVLEVIPDAREQGYLALLDRVYTTGEPFHGDEMPVRFDFDGDGVPEERFFNIVYQPLRDHAGAVYGILTHSVDVTAQVHARRDVERKAEELVRLTHALEQSNRELDQFAYVASHDLKAPLRGIANLAEWIEEDLGERVTGDSKEHLRLLKGRVHRMEALIDGILAYSRAARARAHPERVDAGAVVADVVDLLAPPAGVVTVAPDMPTLTAERVPLQQTFMNIIANALKHGRAAEPRVRVTWRDAGDAYEFAVADNGAGIAPEFHERIWGIFQTLQARDKVEGTGIGLAVVRKIVESRGGRAWVESAPDEGATFRFTWPKAPVVSHSEGAAPP